jgi:hypothetical protein
VGHASRAGTRAPRVFVPTLPLDIMEPAASRCSTERISYAYSDKYVRIRTSSERRAKGQILQDPAFTWTAVCFRSRRYDRSCLIDVN